MACHLQADLAVAPASLETAHGGEQRLGIGVMGRREDLLDRALLHDLAEIHHRHPVGDVAHQRQVVADEHHGRAAVPLDVEQQGDDRRLHRDVERRDGLIRHDEFRAAGEGARDGDALLLPAGELATAAARQAPPAAGRFRAVRACGLDFDR